MTAPGPAPLQNIYYERKTGTARPCYVCRKPTQTVLATLKTEDFLYTCDGHLLDPGFASLIAAPPAGAAAPSPEDIQKVVSEYQAREAKKASKGDTPDSSKPQGKQKDAATSPTPKSPISTTPASPAPAAPTHRKFALHRQMFEMRKAEMRRREQGAKAKEVSKGLPQVPRNAF